MKKYVKLPKGIPDIDDVIQVMQNREGGQVMEVKVISRSFDDNFGEKEGCKQICIEVCTFLRQFPSYLIFNEGRWTFSLFGSEEVIVIKKPRRK